MNVRAILVVVSAVAVGCWGGDGTDSVDGVVTLDGKPLSDGTIRFEPVDRPGATAGGTIRDGRFTTKLLAGRQRVRINSPQFPAGSAPAAQAAPGEVYPVDHRIPVETVPEQFNAKSELIVEPTAGAPLVFDLKSK